jgi:outer membrane receptor protein involved in Fe transport
LLVAAAVEPQRSLLRSYLGKALADSGERALALHELELAHRLDTNDPTALLYSALLKAEGNQINAAIQDLETAQQLNDNRQLYRSRLLLDQDRAVRSANLAGIYEDSGMTDVSVREATRAVNFDYANYSAHLFLANSYARLTDPKQANLRYETAAFSEYLVANLLAPVGAGVLSPTVSQQEYSKLFERDGAHFSSATEYLSRGAWQQAAAFYGTHGNTSYSLEADYLSDNGQQPNSDFERRIFSLQVRQQVSSMDTAYLQIVDQQSQGGDTAQYYDPAQTNPDFRFEDEQSPALLAGWHREWSPESHTLLVGARLDDVFKISNANQPVFALAHNASGLALVPVPFAAQAAMEYRNQITGYSLEAQHIWQQPDYSLIFGARYQTASVDTSTTLGPTGLILVPYSTGGIDIFSPIPGSQTNLSTDLDRIGAYAYANVQPFASLLLSAGVSYDWVEFPANYTSPPISDAQRETDQLSPKAGVTWQPGDRTVLRGAYTRSLGSAAFENSYRIEPSQVAGFNQALRSLAPESFVGQNAAPSLESFGLALEHRIGHGTYLAVSAGLGREEFTRQLGYVGLTNSPADYQPGLLNQEIEFEEPSLTFTFNQLIGESLAVGAQYRLSVPELTITYPDLVLAPGTQTNLQTNSRLESTLHQLHLFARLNHRSGFFVGLDARWYRQENSGSEPSFAPAPPGDDFWQLDLFAGWRSPRRRLEARVGILNLTDQDYRLSPISLLPELPRERTLTASLRFNF